MRHRSAPIILTALLTSCVIQETRETHVIETDIRTRAAYYNLYQDHLKLQESYNEKCNDYQQLWQIAHDYAYLLIQQNKELEAKGAELKDK
ncbi:MAG TPA: hypothetical protein VJB66_00355 [Candidatus Nanoarchaeia archaeon]|nr:hypothetical protein [Candidatus Nanoarchaeia archaeon]